MILLKNRLLTIACILSLIFVSLRYKDSPKKGSVENVIKTIQKYEMDKSIPLINLDLEAIDNISLNDSLDEYFTFSKIELSSKPIEGCAYLLTSCDGQNHFVISSIQEKPTLDNFTIQVYDSLFQIEAIVVNSEMSPEPFVDLVRKGVVTEAAHEYSRYYLKWSKKDFFCTELCQLSKKVKNPPRKVKKKLIWKPSFICKNSIVKILSKSCP